MSALRRTVALLTTVAIGLVAFAPMSRAEIAESWSAVQDLSEGVNNGFSSKIALSDDGTRATVVWYGSNGTKNYVQSVSATIAGNIATWGETTILSDDSQNAYDPSVGISGDGSRATVVWYRYDGAEYVIQSSSATIAGNSATWSSPTDLSDPIHSATRPVIGVSNDGTKATTVWSGHDGTSFLTQAASASIAGNTATWGTVTDLSDSTNDAYYQSLGVSSDGARATAVWQRHNGSVNVVQAASASVAGDTAIWGDPVDVSTNPGGATAPEIAVSSDGKMATVVWLGESSLAYVFSSSSAVIDETTSTWSPEVQLSENVTNVVDYGVALSDDGSRSTAVWDVLGEHEAPGIVQSASATVAGNSATWSTATTLAHVVGDAVGPVVALSGDGTRATAVWYGDEDYVQSSFATVSGNTAAWSTPTTLADGRAPQVAVSADGTKAIATWNMSGQGRRVLQSAATMIGTGFPLTYSGNGSTSGSVPVAVGSPYPAGTAVTVAGPGDLVKSGSTFAGWNTAANGTGTSYDSGALVSMPARQLDLFAQWNAPPPVPRPNQAVVNNCVTVPKSLPRKGTKRLMKPKCITNAGQRVGTRIVTLSGKPRYTKLLCQTDTQKRRGAERASKASANGRICKEGSLKIRTLGTKVKVRVVWKAQATDNFQAYEHERVYKS